MAFPQGAGRCSPAWRDPGSEDGNGGRPGRILHCRQHCQVISKSGTNDYHGGAFWDYNGNRLKRAQLLQRRQCRSASTTISPPPFGGPIKKEQAVPLWRLRRLPRSRHRTPLSESVPLPAWRTGNFTTGCQPGRLIDPTTGQPFPGNIIPPNRISKVSQNIQSYAYPLPNSRRPGALAQ